MTSLPQSIPDDFSLRCVIPRIWTQKQSRSFGIYWSKTTDHGVLYPAPTDDELTAFYRQDHYDRYLSGEHAVQFDAPLTVPYRVLIKIAYLNDKSVPDPIPTILSLSPATPRVCDLGCGGGNFLEAIRMKGASVVGVDPSDVSGAAVVKKGIEFHAGTGENIPAELPRANFDVVTMFHSLEHCRDVALSLRNARDLLKPGGLCVIEVPNMECLGFQKYPEVWIHTDAGRHLQFFTEKSLNLACSTAGMSPIKVEFTGFAHQFGPARVKKMQLHWDALFGDGSVKPVAPRASFGTALSHLLRALISPARERYDIIRVYARRN